MVDTSSVPAKYTLDGVPQIVKTAFELMKEMLNKRIYEMVRQSINFS